MLIINKIRRLDGALLESAVNNPKLLQRRRGNLRCEYDILIEKI
jgi:hypothetical protein